MRKKSQKRARPTRRKTSPWPIREYLLGFFVLSMILASTTILIRTVFKPDPPTLIEQLEVHDLELERNRHWIDGMNNYRFGQQYERAWGDKGGENHFFRSAVKDFQAALIEDPEQPELWFNLGNAYFKLGDYEYSVLAYQRAEALDPEDKDVKNNIDLARRAHQAFLKDPKSFKRPLLSAKDDFWNRLGDLLK